MSFGKKTKLKVVSSFITAAMIFSSIPVTVLADDGSYDNNDDQAIVAETSVLDASTDEQTANTVVVDVVEDDVDENVTSIPEDDSDPTTEVTEDIEEPPIEETTEATDESEDVVVEPSEDVAETTVEETEETTVETTEETEETTEPTEVVEPIEPDVTVVEPTEEPQYVEFDHYFSTIDENMVTTSDLLIQADSATVFTYNTNVVSNYDDMYVISCASVEEARYVYSYYIDKVENISDMRSVMTLASEDGEDVADLSDINNGSDAIANLNDITVSDYSGYIALIDTGANADANFSVIGDNTGDSHGHGTAMLNFIKEENPNAQVMSIKVTENGAITVADVYAAFRLAIDSNVSVINFSMVGADVERNAIIKEVIQEALDKNIVVIGAAGNNSADATRYIPGSIAGVITVGAVNEDGTKYATSNYNADLYVVATSTSEATARYTGIYTAGIESDKVFATLATEQSESHTSSDVVSTYTFTGDNGYTFSVTQYADGSCHYELVEDVDITLAAHYDRAQFGEIPGLGTGTTHTDTGRCDFTRNSDHLGYGVMSNIRSDNSGNNTLQYIVNYASAHTAGFGGPDLGMECWSHFDRDNPIADSTKGAYSLPSFTDGYYKAEISVSNPDANGHYTFTVQVWLSMDNNFEARPWQSPTRTYNYFMNNESVTTRAGTKEHQMFMTLQAILHYKVSTASGTEWHAKSFTETYEYTDLAGYDTVLNSVRHQFRDSAASYIAGLITEYNADEYSGTKGLTIDNVSYYLGNYTDYKSVTVRWKSLPDNSRKYQIYYRPGDGTGTSSREIEVDFTKVVTDAFSDVVADDPDSYNFDGTTYTYYSSYNGALNNTSSTLLGRIRFDENGETDDSIEYSVTNGFDTTVYIRETAAGTNYLLDNNIYVIRVYKSGDDVKLYFARCTSATGRADASTTTFPDSGTLELEFSDIPTTWLNLHKVVRNVSGSYNYNLVTEGNSCYSLNGTNYQFYTDANCTNSVYTVSLNANGNHSGYYHITNYPTTLYLKETQAGHGFTLDPTVYTITITNPKQATITNRNDATMTRYGDVWQINVSDVPILDPITIELRKIDNNGKPVANSTLSGVTYRLYYYTSDLGASGGDINGYAVAYDITISGTTNAQGVLRKVITLSDLQSMTPVGGNNRNYLSNLGNTPSGAFPLGTIRIEEQTAPAGYQRNTQVVRLRLLENNFVYSYIEGNDGYGRNRWDHQLNGDTATLTNEDTQTSAIYRLEKHMDDTYVFNGTYGFEYEFWDMTDNILIATGVSETDGKVKWTYVYPGADRDNDGQPDGYYANGDPVHNLYNTTTYSLEVPVGPNDNPCVYQVRELKSSIAIKYGNTQIPYTYSAPISRGVRWSETDDYYYLTYNSLPGYDEITHEDITNNYEWGDIECSKTIPDNDQFDDEFDLTQVTFELYNTDYNVLIATGNPVVTRNSAGKITDVTVAWTRVAQSGYGITRGSYTINQFEGNIVRHLPLGNYRVEERWNREYLEDLDGTMREIIATNNSGWTLDDTNADYVRYYYNLALTRDEYLVSVATGGAATNDVHEQWFNAAKVVTTQGDASTINFELFAVRADGSYHSTALGTATSTGVGTFPVEWNTYNGLMESRSVTVNGRTLNNVDTLSLLEGDYRLVEYVPTTYYDNGRNNVPYSYICPDGWEIMWNDEGTHPVYFYKDFHADNNENTVISQTATNTRIEAELTVVKIETIAKPSTLPVEERTFTFEIYYRGNEETAQNVGVFTDAYLLDTITVVTEDGYGEATITKLPEGWYELREVDAQDWKCTWMGANVTPDGKLVRAKCTDITDASKAQIVITDANFTHTAAAINTPAPDVTTIKIDEWTGRAIVTPSAYNNDDVHLIYYLYKDGQNSEGEYGTLEDVEKAAWIARVDAQNDGEVVFEDLELGHYILAEVATINGYYLNTNIIAFEVTSEVSFSVDFPNTPYCEPVRVTKVDNESLELLSGAEFKVFVDTNGNGEWDADDELAEVWLDANNNNHIDAGELSDAVLTETSTGVYETNGGLHWNDGADFSTTYFIVETSAPENYFFVNEDGTFTEQNNYKAFQIDPADTTAQDFYVKTNEFTFRNQTGSVFIHKVDEKTHEFLTGCTFGIYEDEACTSLITTLNDSNIVEVDGVKYYSYKGLYLGTYYIKELSAPEYYETDPNAYEFNITLTQVHATVDNKTWTVVEGVTGEFLNHNPIPRTTLTDNWTLEHVGAVRENITLTDTVYYSGLHVGESYVMEGTLYDKDTGEVVLDTNGNPVTGSTTFTPETEIGTVDVEFTFNVVTATNRTFVAGEKVRHENESKYVGIHFDINDAPQTVWFPNIHTTLVDRVTEDHIAGQGDSFTLVDTVTYTNLVPNLEYTLYGTLMVKETESELLDAEGNPVTASVTFTPTAANGSVDVTFEFDADLMKDTTLVAFETLVFTNANDEEITIATHNDIKDVDQTVQIPDIGTTFYDRDLADDKDTARCAEDVTLVDTVHYENIMTGVEYTVFGTIMVKETGEALKDANGNAVVASTTFTPTTTSGDIEVVFEHVDTTVVEGQTLVAFETLEYKNITLVVHADLEDVDQTVKIPKVRTTLLCEETGEHMVPVDTTVVLVDTVAYDNLIPGKTYTVNGTLVFSELDESGNVVPVPNGTGSTTFTATQPSGTIDVRFTISTSDLAGKTIVAFEDLKVGNKTVNTHADITDVDQTVYVPEIHTTATDKVDGDNVIDGRQTTQTIVDTVTYENLVPGKTYTMTGKLVVKKDYAEGEEFEYVTDDEGNVIEVSVEFTPTTANGTVDVEFTVNASRYAGKKLVAFETVSYENVDLTTHSDIEDEAQTITVSLILHVKIAKADKDNVAYFLKDAEITIFYAELDENGEYITDAEGNVVYTVATDINGNECVGVTDANGEVNFLVNYDENKVYFAQETKAPAGYNINPDKFEVVPTDDRETEGVCLIPITILDTIIIIPPKTGDSMNIGMWVTLIIIATIGLAGGATYFVINKKKKTALAEDSDVNNTTEE